MVGAIIGALASMASNSLNQMHSDKVRREQNIFNHYEAQRAREWNQQMDSTKYQRTVNDMVQAGVNPALAMSGPVSTQAASNAQAQSSTLPVPQVDLSSIAQMYMMQRQLDQNEKLVDSQSRKNNAEAEGIEISNKYAEEYNELLNKGMRLTNDLTYNQSKEVLKRIDNIEATIELVKKQTDNEEERKGLIIAEKDLKQAMRDKTEEERLQLIALLPFQQQLMLAQTDNQKAQASLALIKASYEQKLLKSDYINDLIREMKARADSAEARAQIDHLQSIFESGNPDEFFKGVDELFKHGRIPQGLFAFIRGCSKMVGAVIGDIASPIVKAAGSIFK